MAGRVVIITGASSGVGAATARTLVAAGDKVVLGARRADKLLDLAAELGEAAAWAETDVAKRADVEALAALALQRFGRIDALVNNAAILPMSLIEQGLVEDWEQMIDVNIKGVLYGIHAVLGTMLAQGGGTIINISSVTAAKAAPMMAVYSGTKAAVRMIADGLRQEAKGRIRVSTIMPSAINTGLHESVTLPQIRAHAAASMATAMEPEAVAQAILYVLDQPANVLINELAIRGVGDDY